MKSNDVATLWFDLRKKLAEFTAAAEAAEEEKYRVWRWYEALPDEEITPEADAAVDAAERADRIARERLESLTTAIELAHKLEDELAFLEI